MSDITELYQIDLRSGQLAKPCWSFNGRFLAVPTESGSIVILDAGTMKTVQTLGLHSGAVTTVGWNREGEFIVSGSLDRSIGIWEVSNNRRVGIVISRHNEPLHSMEYTNEGAFAMTCSRDRVRALDGFCLEAGWYRDTEDEINTYGPFTAASCSFNTTLLLALAAKNGERLILTSLLTGEALDTISMQQPIRTLAWSPADTVLAAASGSNISIVPATTELFSGPPNQITADAPGVDALAFSSDGQLLASHDAEGLKVWDTKTRKPITKLEETWGASRKISASTIAFHPSKLLLAAVHPSGTALRILDLSKLV